MKQAVTLIMLCLTILTASGQATQDTIEIQRGPNFFMQGKPLNVQNVGYILRANPEAKKEMTIAINNHNTGALFGYLGGFLVGYSVVQLINGEYNWQVTAIGGGLAAISIPFSLGYSKHSKKAVRMYNYSLTHPTVTSMNTDANMRIGVGSTTNGIGITVSF